MVATSFTLSALNMSGCSARDPSVLQMMCKAEACGLFNRRTVCDEKINGGGQVLEGELRSELGIQEIEHDGSPLSRYRPRAIGPSGDREYAGAGLGSARPVGSPIGSSPWLMKSDDRTGNARMFLKAAPLSNAQQRLAEDTSGEQLLRRTHQGRKVHHTAVVNYSRWRVRQTTSQHLKSVHQDLQGDWPAWVVVFA
jgi:hypothetical protein